MDSETREKWMAARVTHGAYLGGVESPEHSTWRSMLARCHNPNNKHYRYYGGKGVSVCERWLEYDNFLADMGCRPSTQVSLDRIDLVGNYEPGNCRWATRSQQQKNKSTTKVYTNGTFTGVLVECAEYLGVSKALAHWRWKQWGTFEKGKEWQQLQKNL